MRKFTVPDIDINAVDYYNLIDLDNVVLTEPPVLARYKDEEVGSFRDQKLVLKHPCNNQAVERHVKVVSEASSKVVGPDRRDGLIRQKLKSRRLMKCFNTKSDYSC